MNREAILKSLFWLWAAWHLIFGLLSTFAPEIGASAIGWEANSGWSDELITMSTQYGMTMVLLAGVFAIAALDPSKYLAFVWVAVAEQVLGILYAAYIYVLFGQLTVSQMLVQAAINSVVVAIFVIVWLGMREGGSKMARA